MTAEERAVFQGIIDHFYDGFVSIVAKQRPALDEAQVRELADGRVWTAHEALELGFVDQIGTLRTALAAIKHQIGAQRVRVVTYHRPLDWKPNIYASQPGGTPQVNLINIDLPSSWTDTAPRFLYLWAPGW
jgi:protease IV